eukprot:UN30605
MIIYILDKIHCLLIQTDNPEKTKKYLKTHKVFIDELSNEEIKDTKFVRVLLQYYIDVSEAYHPKSKLNALYDISGGIRHSSTQLKHATQAEFEHEKRCVNEKTVPEVAKLLFSNFDQELNWIDHGINLLKVLQPFNEKEEDFNHHYINRKTRLYMIEQCCTT